MIPDRSSPSRVRFAASRPGPLRADLERRAVHEGKGGVRAVWTGRKGTFRPYQPLEPQPRGAVTRRAVAQRRSRASGLTRPLAEAIRGFDSGFGLGFVVGPLARSAAVWRKVFVFSSLPIRKVLVFREARAPLLGGLFFFSVSYPQTRRSYYLFFTTCSLLFVRVGVFSGAIGGGGRRFQRGKLAQITQACGNRRFTALWPFT